jgi:hypothetical protein
MKRTVALVSLVILAVGVGLVVYWLRPIKPASLVLIGSGYESNLLLPNNVHGWNGLRALEKEVATKEDFQDLLHFRLEPPTKMHQVGDGPVELKEQGWSELWDKINIGAYKEKTVVVFISLHGMADDQKAYLLPNVTGKQKKSFMQSRVALDDVLDSLKKVKNKKVALILDVSQVEANWPTGMLHNDFIERLQDKYEKEITANDNLVVIASAGPDQRSWASDELQRSAFAHFVALGLKGAGHPKGANVSAFSLFDYVKTKVDAWAQTNRARKQTPILLGGESRAKGIDLVHIEEPAEEKMPAPPALDETALKAEWVKWKDLKETQAPYVHSPQIWRLYQDTMLRYEQIVRAGDPTGKAADLKNTLEKLHSDLTVSRSLTGAYPSLGNSIPMFRLLGYRPASDVSDPKLREFLVSLRQFDNAKPETLEEKTKLLARFREKSQLDKQYLRSRFAALILKDLQGRLPRERDRLYEIENELGAPMRPVEGQLLRMLQDADDKLDPATIKLVLDVRVLAEETALSAFGDGTGELYAEAIYPWIRADIDSADKLRRAAQDELFGDSATENASAVKKLDDARKQYEQAAARAKKLRTAFALRDEVAAELPYLAAWLASAPPLSDQNKIELQNLQLATQELGISLGKLTKALDAEDRKALPTAELTTQIDGDLKAIREEFQNTCERLKTLAGQQKNWHAIDAALAVPPPGADIALRLDLLRRQRDIAGKLLNNQDLEGKTEKEDAIDVRAKRQRDMLRACIKPAEDIRGLDKENLDDKAREFFFKLPEQILTKTDLAEGDGPDLVAAANGCRVIPGAFVDQLKDDSGKRVNPVDRLRRLRIGELLCRLAERTLEDHWFEPGPNRVEPYYEFAGKAYLASARGLFDDGQMPEAFGKRVERLKNKFTLQKLQIAKLKELYWTTESNFSFDYRVMADKDLPQGTPMIWLEVTKGKVTEKAWPRKPMTSWPDFKDAFVLDKSKFAGEGDVTINLHAYYRGQHVVQSSPAIRSQPDVIARHFPAPKDASIAVRMDASFDFGAISIVLDNSGSMKYRHPKKGDKDEVAKKNAGEERRFDFALRGLGHVLRKIPDNTELSIFTLGRKEGTGYKTGAAVFREPTRWQQKTEFNELLASLYDLPGDIGSPIAETVIKSMEEGFSKDFKGPKVVLVLTDGDDNVSYSDEGPNNRNRRIVDELKRANERHPDITVVVVCFIDKNVNADEFRSAESQFKVVETFKLPGKFMDVSEGDKIGAIIEDLIRPRLLLSFNDNVAPHPINYHNDRALNWKEVPPGDYKAFVPRTLSKNVIDLNLDPPQKLFMVLTREDEKLTLRRGLVSTQPETESRGAIRKERAGWYVSLVENENKGLMTTVLKELLVIEKKQTEEYRIRQVHPGFVWVELDAVNGQKPDRTLYWWKDWNVPAPAFRLEMRDWPANVNPKVSTWFWPKDKGELLADEKLVTRTRRVVPHREPLSTVVGQTPIVESVEWDENREVDSPTGAKIKRKCLVVRVRYPEGKPVWIDLDQRLPGIGSEHHYFSKARSCTAYFYGISKLEGNEANLVLLHLNAFKAAAQEANFTPDGRIEAPRLFVPEGR